MLLIRYGSHGYEMINVTYVGDTLIAFKVTGDKNVPRGEITFQADLTPPAVRNFRGGRRKSDEAQEKPLEPIMLTEKAASKWGTRQLPRYRGLGQVAETDFQNKKWMDGQLIIIGEEYFSFAWVVSVFLRTGGNNCHFMKGVFLIAPVRLLTSLCLSHWKIRFSLADHHQSCH